MSNKNWRESDFDERSGRKNRRHSETYSNISPEYEYTPNRWKLVSFLLITAIPLIAYFAFNMNSKGDVAPPINGEVPSARYVASLEDRVEELFNKNEELEVVRTKNLGEINRLKDIITTSSGERQKLIDELDSFRPIYKQDPDFLKNYAKRENLIEELCKLTFDPQVQVSGSVSFETINTCQERSFR